MSYHIHLNLRKTILKIWIEFNQTSDKRYRIYWTLYVYILKFYNNLSHSTLSVWLVLSSFYFFICYTNVGICRKITLLVWHTTWAKYYYQENTNIPLIRYSISAVEKHLQQFKNVNVIYISVNICTYILVHKFVINIIIVILYIYKNIVQYRCLYLYTIDSYLTYM